MRMRMAACVVVAAMLAGGAASAEEERKTRLEQVKRVVEKAATLVREKGEAAYEPMTSEESDLVEGNIYPFCMDFTGLMLAHPNKKLVGKNIMKIKDVHGKNFIATFIEVVKSEKGAGWVDYTWAKPGEKKGSPKVSYVKRVPGKDLFVGAGIYDVTMEDIQSVLGE